MEATIETTLEGVAAKTDLIVFRSSPIHGKGGFAKQKIRQGSRVMEYVGERISKGESLRRCEQNNEFIFSLNESQTWMEMSPGTRHDLSITVARRIVKRRLLVSAIVAPRRGESRGYWPASLGLLLLFFCYACYNVGISDPNSSDFSSCPKCFAE